MFAAQFEDDFSEAIPAMIEAKLTLFEIKVDGVRVRAAEPGRMFLA